MSDVSQYWLKSKSAKTDADSSWWYADKGGIEIYVQHNAQTFKIRLLRSRLKDYINKVEHYRGRWPSSL